MAKKDFASYKYNTPTGSAVSIGTLVRHKLFMLLLLLAVGAAVYFFPHGLFALMVPLIAYLFIRSSQNCLIIGNRYLINGNQIIYFKTIQRLVKTQSGQTLKLIGHSGNAVTIEQDRFPTNARKPQKIAINKRNKFNKVCDKIISRMALESPSVAVEHQ